MQLLQEPSKHYFFYRYWRFFKRNKNKKLAEGLRFTTQENRWLTDHYNNYPESPDGFEAWSTKLRTRIADANTKLERFQN